MKRITLAPLTLLFAIAPTIAATHSELQTKMPEGHPVLNKPQPAEDIIPDVPKDAGTGEMSLSWNDPPDWIRQTPANEMRRAQYEVPGKAGSGQCVVYYFGPGQGGEPEANVNRWADQFSSPDGRAPREALATESIEVNGVPVLLAEIAGTYAAGRMSGGGGRLRPDFMLLGAVASGPDSNWFFKLTGPQPTIEAHREAFRAMIDSIREGE